MPGTGSGCDTGAVLADGRYDALVVDAEVADDGSIGLDLTIVSGPAKGEVVTLRTRALEGDPLDLLGVPATLVVRDGAPDLTLES